MAYSNFTLSQVKADFGIQTIETESLFSQTPAIPPGELLTLNLHAHLSLATAINTEKARSELIIMPVLTEVRRLLQGRVSLFSGVEFTADPERGLNGICDFILSQSPEQFFVAKPVVTIVEAKRENIPSGLGQCIATMIAAQLFNQQVNQPKGQILQGDQSLQIIYGAVTTGTDWKFLKLIGQHAYIDANSYFINQVDQILGILVSTCQPELATR